MVRNRRDVPLRRLVTVDEIEQLVAFWLAMLPLACVGKRSLSMMVATP